MKKLILFIIAFYSISVYAQNLGNTLDLGESTGSTNALTLGGKLPAYYVDTATDQSIRGYKQFIDSISIGGSAAIDTILNIEITNSTITTALSSSANWTTGDYAGTVYSKDSGLTYIDNDYLYYRGGSNYFRFNKYNLDIGTSDYHVRNAYLDTIISTAIYISSNSNRFLFNSGTQNTVLGEGAGNLAAPGSWNTIFGYAAGNKVTGNYNSIFGRNAGNSNTSGNQNTYQGSTTGYYNATGFGNTAIGYAALFGTSGQNHEYSTAIGFQAGKVAYGSHNLFLGNSAGISNTSGAYNTIVGDSAGYSNLTGGYNVFLGHSAGKAETGSNRLYIANSAGTPLIGGRFDLNIVDITETINFTNDSVTILTLNDINVAFIDTTTSLTTTFGYGTSAVGTNSAFFGYKAGENCSVSCLRNTYVGTEAGQSTLGGSDNVAFGYRAYELAAGGSNLNSCVGVYSGQNLGNGDNNAFLGANTGSVNSNHNQNTLIGSDAGRTIDGSQNTYVGFEAGENTTTVTGNTYLGYEAGTSAGTQSKNIFIGYQAGATYTSTDSTFILDIADAGAGSFLYGDMANDTLTLNGSMIITGNAIFIQDSLETWGDCTTLSDDDSLDVANGIAGTIELWVNDGVQDEYIKARVYSNGTVTLIANNGSVASADTDANLCLYNRTGTITTIKNRLGAKYKICYEFKTSR